MLTCLPVLLLLCAIGVSASAQTLRFYAVPYRVNEGDGVTFNDLETTNTYPKSAFASWNRKTFVFSPIDRGQLERVFFSRLSRDCAGDGVGSLKAGLRTKGESRPASRSKPDCRHRRSSLAFAHA